MILGRSVLSLLALLVCLFVLPGFLVRQSAAQQDDSTQASQQEDKAESAGNARAVEKVQKEKKELLESKSTFDRGIAYARDDRVGTEVL